MNPRRLLAVVAWTLLVLICSAGVWSVIRTAGTGVTTSPEVPSTVLGTARATSPGATPPASPTASKRPHQRATPRPSPTRGAPAATNQPPDSAGDGPAATTGQGNDHGSSQGHASDKSQDTAADPGPPEVRRTWQSAAGAVVASCRGATIDFRGAQPNSGWRVEVGERGPEKVEVKFTTHQDDEGEVEVEARCTAGEPRFSTAGD